MSDRQELQVNQREFEILTNLTGNLILRIESQGEALGASNFGGFLNRRAGDQNYFYPLFWLENGALIADLGEEIFVLGTSVQSKDCADLVVSDPHGSPVHLGQYFSLIEENGDTQLVITPTEYLLRGESVGEVFSALVLNTQHHLFKDINQSKPYNWNPKGVCSAIAKIYNPYNSMADVRSFFASVAQDENLSYLIYLLMQLNKRLYCPEPAQNV